MEAPKDHPIHSFYAALRNLQKLEQEDFREIIKGQINPTARERYMTINYHRAAFNVEMMVGIKETKQFQTLALLSRTIFELAVEMKSITLDPNAAAKIELFSKMEVLRASRKVLEFKKTHPDSPIHHKMQTEFVARNGAQIDAEELAMWPPNPKTGKKRDVKHWTLMNVYQRAMASGDPFDRIYDVHYAPLSWMTHTGVIAPVNMTSDWVMSFVSSVYSIAIDSYMAILGMLVAEFRLSATNEHIMKKIVCNRDLGLTRTAEEGEVVMRKHGLWGIFELPKPWPRG